MTGAPHLSPESIDGFASALIAGDADGAEQEARSLLSAGMSLLSLYELLTDTLERVGRCWASGEMTVAEEHLATAAAARLVSRLRGAPPQAVRGTVVLTTPAGEQHVLGIQVLEHLFEEARFRTLALGDLPLGDLVDLVSRTEFVRAVLFSCHVADPDALRAAVHTVREAAPDAHVLLGGPAFAQLASSDKKFGAHAVRTTARDALATVDALTSPLTRREAEILELVAEGLTNKEAGERLGVAASTVKDHVEGLMNKLEAPSRAGAVAAAFRLGLLR